MGDMVIGVECRAAGAEKCYMREIVAAAEDFQVPLTWLIGVSLHDPMGNAALYRDEYLHRIPAWHEVGVLLIAENGADCPDSAGHCDLARLGKDVLKQLHVKPVCCKLTGADLAATSVKTMEDIGILVAAGNVAGCCDCAGEPYHPALSDVRKPGDARLVVLPHGGASVLTGEAMTKVRSGAPLTFGVLRDDEDPGTRLRELLEAATQSGATVRTLTPACLV